MADGKCCPTFAPGGVCKQFGQQEKVEERPAGAAECFSGVWTKDGKCCLTQAVWKKQCCPEPLRNGVCVPLQKAESGGGGP